MSSLLISLFINAPDISLSMLFNLLLANITIVLCFFFLFHVVFNHFFTMPVDITNARLKLALAVPAGAPITFANDAIKMLLLFTDKAIKDFKIIKRSNIFIKPFTH